MFKAKTNRLLGSITNYLNANIFIGLIYQQPPTNQVQAVIKNVLLQFLNLFWMKFFLGVNHKQGAVLLCIKTCVRGSENLCKN